MADMKIIGQLLPQAVYLVEIDEKHARVLDLEQRRMYPPYPKAYLLAQSAWQEPRNPNIDLDDLLKGVTVYDDRARGDDAEPGPAG
jgi:hypothetical protein